MNRTTAIINRSGKWMDQHERQLPILALGVMSLAALLLLTGGLIHWLVGLIFTVIACGLVLGCGFALGAYAATGTRYDDGPRPLAGDTWDGDFAGNPAGYPASDNPHTTGSFVIPPDAIGAIGIPNGTLYEFIQRKHAEWTGQNPPEITGASPQTPEQRLLDALDQPDDEPDFGANYPFLAEIHEEMLAQLNKWGVQTHANGTGGAAAKNNRTKARNAVEQAAAAGDSLTWAMILLEEVWEAIAANNLDELDIELTQVAAVCATWKQDIARGMAAQLGMEANPQ